MESGNLNDTTEKMRILREKLAQQKNAMIKQEKPSFATSSVQAHMHTNIVTTVQKQEPTVVEKKEEKPILQQKAYSFDIEHKRQSIGKFLMVLMDLDRELYEELREYVKTLFQIERDGFRAYKSQEELLGTELDSWRSILQDILDTRELSPEVRKSMLRCMQGE